MRTPCDQERPAPAPARPAAAAPPRPRPRRRRPARHDRLAARLAERAGGRRAVITGASGAIGRQLAVLLGQAGADLVLLGRDRRALAETARLAAPVAGTVRVHAADLTVPADIARFTERLTAECGGADILVNNAGRSIRRGAAHAVERPHDYRRTMAVNYFGAVDLTLRLLPGMRERGHGHIVNVATIGLQLGMGRFTAYNPSKAALEAFGQSLAPELRRDGVRVSTVHLPLVRTPMSAPTTAFARLPALEPRQAARMICAALVTGSPRVSTPLGTLGELLGVAAPRVRLALAALEYRLLPESAGALRGAR
ncbi:SDR family NAD(P)-dependent oxidoreductase [Streptomyces caatingaensis]|uniref:SDR family NAD(P)-dependent oxidoreductase n=1 Tax=Streptomyces caatingaensis TaxID=1678637 RepID=UPI00067274FA|nr:SDR family NAD(P)-dependent oxidoreductase [Streptomyces caatingaensis]